MYSWGIDKVCHGECVNCIPVGALGKCGFFQTQDILPDPVVSPHFTSVVDKHVTAIHVHTSTSSGNENQSNFTSTNHTECCKGIPVEEMCIMTLSQYHSSLLCDAWEPGCNQIFFIFLVIEQEVWVDKSFTTFLETGQKSHAKKLLQPN